MKLLPACLRPMPASVVTMLLLTTALVVEAAATDRWYSEEQVNTGADIFTSHCAGCHGLKAEGTPHWKRRLADGSLPPPPLNGTAHSWHHQLPLLRRTIKEGGEAFGGKMPGFKGKLTEQQIDAVIAWFQSQWSNEVYARWSGEGIEKIEQPQIIKELLDGI